MGGQGGVYYYSLAEAGEQHDGDLDSGLAEGADGECAVCAAHRPEVVGKVFDVGGAVAQIEGKNQKHGYQQAEHSGVIARQKGARRGAHTERVGDGAYRHPGSLRNRCLPLAAELRGKWGYRILTEWKRGHFSDSSTWFPMSERASSGVVATSAGISPSRMKPSSVMRRNISSKGS